jgi:hypothetical protein
VGNNLSHNSQPKSGAKSIWLKHQLFTNER